VLIVKGLPPASPLMSGLVLYASENMASRDISDLAGEAPLLSVPPPFVHGMSIICCLLIASTERLGTGGLEFCPPGT
jgi:hypothetical protein